MREDLPKVSVPALILHGDSDGIVPFEGSGQRVNEALLNSQVQMRSRAHVTASMSVTARSNDALIAFLAKSLKQIGRRHMTRSCGASVLLPPPG
ncbi:MAG: hypothetical protein NVS3B26_18060 [Mycobacteriales bacterium]